MQKDIVDKTLIETKFFFFLQITQADGHRLSEYAEGSSKANFGSIKLEQVTGKVNFCYRGTSWRSLLQVPISNLVQSFPINMGKTPPQNN